MLRNRVFYVLLLLAATLIYIFTNTYYTLMLLVLCIILPMLSLVLMLFARRGLAITIDVPKTAEKKDAAIKYTFDNGSKFPVARVMFRVKLENQMTGAVKKRMISASIGGGKTIEAELELKDSKVGTVLISTEKIRVFDAFGLFSLRKSNLSVQDMIIYPDMKDVKVLMERSVETGGDAERFSPDRAGLDVSEVFALREYAAGDEIRKIHWKLSSKIDKMMVRDFSLPLNYSVFLLLELKHGSEELVDAQVEVYLAISRALLENGINHNIGWYDAGDGTFGIKALDDFEDYELGAAEVLSAYAGDNKSGALEYYTAGGYRNQNNILLYVVSDPDLDKIAELEVAQRMQTILIYEEESEAETAKQTIDVIPVSIQDAAHGVPEIIV